MPNELNTLSGGRTEMRQFLGQLAQLPRRDKWLLVVVVLILIAIVIIILYGIRQSELAEEQEAHFKEETEAATERNRLELEKQAAESAAQIEALKRQAAEVSYRQSQIELRDIKGTLRTVSKARAQEQKDYENKIKGIITANVKACEKWIANCNRAKRLGIRDPDAPCVCR